MVLRCAANLTHVTGHLSALVNVAGSLAATDRTGTTVHHVTVCFGLAVEVETLHYALKTATFCRADNVNHLAFGKLGDRHYVARFVVRGIVDAEFYQFRQGCDARFF